VRFATACEWTDARARQLLREMFSAAIASANPALVLAGHLPDLPKGRVVVVGAGKAAGAMALAVESAWPDVPLTGVVVTPYGYGIPTRKIKVREAAHPVPDENSVIAAREMLEAVGHLTADDLVLGLISGGGSSVLALPADGLTLQDKQAVNRALLASGLDIRTMNVIRRRLSAIKGGKLAAAAAPARVVTLAISDIPGDDPGAIASGPTVPDESALTDIHWALDRLKGSLPPAVLEHLRRPTQATPASPESEFRMVATPAAALDAAASIAREAGLDVEILGDDLEGEAREVGAAMASLTLSPRLRPRVILSGGETTVTIGNGRAGRGGRNSEFLLALAHALNGAPGVWALAADTDGEDGASGGAAGAIVAPDTIQRGLAAGLDIAASLAAHDSANYFDRLGDAIVTGPTRTNVNDFRAILIRSQAFGKGGIDGHSG
jgi:hydroxypyruvate reductase